MCTKLEVNNCSHSWEKVGNVLANQRSGRPSWIFGSERQVTTLGWDLIRIICTKLEVNRSSHSWEKVENVSANQRPWRPSWIFRSAQKVTTLVRDLIKKEHLYQVRSQSLQSFLRRSRKCLSQSESRVAILNYPICAKSNNTWPGPHKEHLYEVRS